MTLARRLRPNAPVRPASEKRVFLITEAVGPLADEGYRNFAIQIHRALERMRPVTAFTAGGDPSSGMQRIARTPLILLGPTLVTALRKHQPDTVIYLCKNSTTLAGIARARLLKLVARGAVTLMVGLQPRRLSPVAGLLARAMWTDLLLVTSERERREAARAGANAVSIHTGVDLTQFHPPQPGQKLVLRSRWGLPIEGRIVLHIGHLKAGRNLEALYPLTTLPETTVVVLASSRRERSSASLRDDLVWHGVRVLEGYRHNVADLYRLADCYVFPVESSNSAISAPLSVLEALACGVPVVSRRFGALYELFPESSGIRFVDEGDDLIGAVRATFAEPKRAPVLGPEWSWDAVASRMLALREQFS